MNGFQITLIFQALVSIVDAGLCWKTVLENGRCQHLYKNNLSKEDCCKHGLISMAWSNHDEASPAKLFYWEAFLGGAPNCEKCHDTCKHVNCGAGKKCTDTKKGPKCVCRPVCTKEQLHGKVCGTNRKSFKNQCRLLAYNCRHGQKVEIAYHGKCRKSCKNVKCTEGATMEDQNGMPHCIPCIKHCPPAKYEYEQICGSDGVTYQSMCHIRKIACENAFQITVVYPGKCRENTTCDTLQCPKDRKCLLDKDTNQSKCVMCAKICEADNSRDHPVCGSNGITYKHFCDMRHAACDSGVVISTKHNGKCKTHKRRNKKRHGAQTQP